MRHIRPIRFTKLAVESAPQSSGVYVLWAVTAIGGLRPLYVGFSRTSIRSRLTSHFSGSHNDDLNIEVRALRNGVAFCWLAARPDRAKMIESYLIKRLRPQANVSEN